MWPLVTYSNCFKIVSTVAFLVSRTIGMFVVDTVILYHYTLQIMITQGIANIICSAWFLEL